MDSDSSGRLVSGLRRRRAFRARGSDGHGILLWSEGGVENFHQR